MTNTESTQTSKTIKKTTIPSTSKDPQEMHVEDSDSNENGYEEGTEEDNVSDVKQVGEKRKYKPRAKKADCWKYFGKQYKDKDGKIKARCNFCNKPFAADSNRNGTNGLNKHFKRCTSNPANLAKDQPEINAQHDEGGQPTFTAWKFDPAKDGLKAEHFNVECIRNAVKFVRHSSNRISAFKSYALEKGIQSKAFLSLDVPTRWSSTYEMLARAAVFEKAFDLYAVREKDFRKSLDVVPCSTVWKYVEKVIELLKIFSVKTTEVSCSTYVIAHEHYSQVKDISHQLAELTRTCVDNTPDIRNTLNAMSLKFDKYFEDAGGKINQIFEFAAILDPRLKLLPTTCTCMEEIEIEYPNRKDMLESEYQEILDKKVGLVTSEMQLLVNEYEKIYQTGTRIPVRKENVVRPIQSGKNSWMSKYASSQQIGTQTFGKRSELEKYLKDAVEEQTEDFDILQWWKFNAARYPTLAKMAKDILAIPISSVASESAFSTGGRVIEPCRSSLSPQIVEALICSQDWIRRERKETKGKIESNEEIDELEKYDDIDKELNVGVLFGMFLEYWMLAYW
ncbi:hypothetical protein SSX86_007532 [Deinandra increscens subsp. villosa]|uniref:BED-type domain-containing protein n=1 Tax=Deinandra increscens subsp. villosa TaxID=3103831 RepID=A0AAP0DLH3_9ASTR